MLKPIIKIENVSHRYSTAWAIRDINIEIDKQAIYGLVGSNGAGKSTTLNILCGVLTQSKGNVYINGIDLQKRPIEGKEHIGFLPQVAPLYLDLTVYEYLTYCARLRNVRKANIPTAIEEVMEKCGIVQVRNRLLRNLSGGYRQRAGIAQSIIHNPLVVIMDEPTNGLDPMQIVEMRNLIKTIAYERTIIISSHILSEVQVMCQQIIMIEQGKIIFSDSMDAFNNYVAPQSIFAEFENPPTAEMLTMINGVNRVEVVDPRSFRIFYDGSRIMGEKIITTSVQKGWGLCQLVIEKAAIDETFKQLAKNTIRN